MADYDRRRGGGGGYNRNKRRFRDDDEGDSDRRGPRRRYDYQPLHLKARKQLLSLAESPLQRGHEEVQALAQLVADNYADSEDLKITFLDLVPRLAIEQPLKTPFVAGVLHILNTIEPDIVGDVLTRIATRTEEKIDAGEWRDVKCCLKLLASIQPCLKDDGVFPILEELFNRAGELQATSSDDTIGTELVKIILLTIPYIMASSPGQFHQQASDLMEKTDIIASEPHNLLALIDPYPPAGSEGSLSVSALGLIQKQLQAEASNGWPLACLPKPWVMPQEETEQREKLENAPKHDLPSISIPETVPNGPRPLFPEVYFSVYADEDVESVPPMSDIASSLIRDSLLDTINILDFNRNVTARYLIDIDCYFADGTFVKRATPFDRLRDVEPGRSTWKPEDVAVDTVFCQLFQLPAPEHKLVYYHSALTEACKIAPAAIAPSLGRAIRYLYRNTYRMDLELSYRFIDWFSHHLSNFGFTWKWTEWVDDVQLPELHPCKAFILGALDKEIRLSFAQRIKGTLPPQYQSLIGPEKEKESPDFKFRDDKTPFAVEGREIATLLKKKAPDEEIEPVIERIHTQALEHNLNPLVASTDVFVTCVCFIGSKSLSHVLACIERTKDRLLNIGAASELARAQIISAVAAFWRHHPGIGVSIVEKLLNYSILTPQSVVHWALTATSTVSQSGFAGSLPGDALAAPHIFEIVFATVLKVTGRVRQVVINPSSAADAAPPSADGAPMDPEQLRTSEIAAMRDLFRVMNDALVSWASATKDEMMETGDSVSEDRDGLVQKWAARWLRVFQRRSAIEESWLLEADKHENLGEMTT
ncbi:hypothetical protein MKZ38_001231 [Zalerion maritima]|uniref:Cap binding protein n=1 Tax=Zalerion maritima TaxID=339359 RepID=A0AAD5RR62_9PEZI|nr:hypothetical protein MKZ38_001231 [Zalerion maritima]